MTAPAAGSFTDGPWWAGEPEPRTGRIVIVSRSRACGVAHVFTRADAALIAEAPAMHEALEVLVGEARQCGYYGQAPYHPRPGCGCGQCVAVRTLVRIEGGGRCLLCGCTHDDACDVGCGWADAEQLVCDAHPKKMIAAALRHFAKESRDV